MWFAINQVKPATEGTMDLNEYKEIITGAINNEIEAQEFYEDAARKLTDPYLREMFGKFAVEEKKHRETLKKIFTSERIERYFNEDRDFKVAETVDTPVLSTQMTPADAIALAMKKEAEAMNQYTEMAAACSDPEIKTVFLDLAAMEREHKFKLEAAFVDIGYPEVWA